MGTFEAMWDAVAGGNSLGGAAGGPGRAGCVVSHLELLTLPRGTIPLPRPHLPHSQ